MVRPARPLSLGLGFMSASSKAWLVLVLLAIATLGAVRFVQPWVTATAVALQLISIIGTLHRRHWAFVITTTLCWLALAQSVFLALPSPEPPEFNLLQSLVGHSVGPVALFLFVAAMAAPWLICLYILSTINRHKSA